MKLLLNNYHNLLSTSIFLLLSLASLNNLFIQCDLLFNEEDHHYNNNHREKNIANNNNNDESFHHVEKNANVKNHVHESLEADEYRTENIANESANQIDLLSKSITEVNHDKSLPVTNNAPNNVTDNKYPITKIVSNKSSLYKYSLNQDVSNKKLINNRKVSNNKYLSSWAFSIPSTLIKSSTKIVENWPLSDYRIEFIEGNDGKSVDEVVNVHRLRWLSHVFRMPEHRLPQYAMLTGVGNGLKKVGGGQTGTPITTTCNANRCWGWLEEIKSVSRKEMIMADPLSSEFNDSNVQLLDLKSLY
ncbi:unnamed protein product [Schistosoma mattheei]|uniref:Uncharacterized protein n=1 Tax=Schistosoma mattheei TaxID=31246 RepID=A0A183NTV8_9TREM|nr:unnamed protein product [Schistosoma mattheei]